MPPGGSCRRQILPAEYALVNQPGAGSLAALISTIRARYWTADPTVFRPDQAGLMARRGRCRDDRDAGRRDQKSHPAGAAPLRRENWAADPPRPEGPATPGAAAFASAGACRLMVRRGRGRPGRLWPRSFADVVAPWRAGPRKRV